MSLGNVLSQETLVTGIAQQSLIVITNYTIIILYNIVYVYIQFNLFETNLLTSYNVD